MLCLRLEMACLHRAATRVSGPGAPTRRTLIPTARLPGVAPLRVRKNT